MDDMHTMQLGGLDLNALVVLDALLLTRSVTAAARSVGLSQSATSHALARLRRTFGDPLLVRGAGGLVATTRAEAMASPLREALAAMQRAVAGPARFDPATAQRRFVLSLADYVGLVMLPGLLQRVAAEAPGVDLQVRNHDGHGGELLARGEFDLMVVPDSRPVEGSGIRARKLFHERFVCLVHRDHPALARRWTLESFVRLRHAVIAPTGRPGGVVDDALAELGLTRRVVLSLPQFLLAPFVVAGSDLVLTLPERVARVFVEQLPLLLVEPPLRLRGFTMQLLWHERSHDDPAHRWLRELCTEVMGVVPGARAKVRGRARVPATPRRGG